MASDKDKCFEEAMDTYQKLRKEAGRPLDIDMTHQTPWVRNPLLPSINWEPIKNIFFREWFHIYGYTKRALGLDTTQVRYPDVTVKLKNGSHLIVDNKFTNNKGGIDPWGRKPNEHSGTNQQDDYKQINEQQGNSAGEKPSLNKDKCKCDERGQNRQLEPQSVIIPLPEDSLFFMPYPNMQPNAIPNFQTGAIPGRLTPNPGFGFRFVFP